MDLYLWAKGLKEYFLQQSGDSVRLCIADGYVLGEVYNRCRRSDDPVLSAEEAARDFFRAIIKDVFLASDLPLNNGKIRITEIAEWVLKWKLLPLCVFFAAVWSYEFAKKGKSNRNYRGRFIEAITWGLESKFRQISVSFDSEGRRISKDSVSLSFAYASDYFSNGIINIFKKLENEVADSWGGKTLYMPKPWQLDFKYGTSEADGITISHAVFHFGDIKRIYGIFGKQKLQKGVRYSRQLFEYLVRYCVDESWMKERSIDINVLTDAVERLFDTWDGTVEDVGGKNENTGIRDLPENVNLKKKMLLMPMKLGLQGGSLKKRVFVEANPNEEIGGRFQNITVCNQKVALCPLNQRFELLSPENSKEDIDKIWNELAANSYEDDIFSFQNDAYYILMRQGLSLMLQQDNLIEDKPFTILCKACEKGKVKNWSQEHKVAIGDYKDICNQWGIIPVVKGCTLLQWQYLSGMSSAKTKKVSDVKLTYGIKASSQEREYLPDFLPDIEAYLPGDFSIESHVEPINNEDDAVRIEQLEDVENCGSISSDDYCWRTFRVYLNSPGVQSIKVSFKVGNSEIGSKVIKVFQANSDDSSFLPKEAQYALDKYGELSIENVNDVHCCESKYSKSEMHSYGDVIEDNDLNHWGQYWKFLDSFKNVRNGRRGVSGRDFWHLWGHYFYGQPQWRNRIDQLFGLGVLDIHSCDDGLWASFQHRPADLCLLPNIKNEKYQILLSGGFSRDNVEQFISCAKDESVDIEVARQRFSLEGCNDSPFVIPPRVIAYCHEISQAERMAKKIGIECVGTLAHSYVQKGASLQDWKESIRQAGISSNGLNAPTPVNGWFSLFDYAMEGFNAGKNEIPSPLEISEFFSPCIRRRIRDYDSCHNMYELIDKKEGMAYPIQDRAWARWAIYDFPKKDERFKGKRFKIAYDEKYGAVILPMAMKLPKILSRAAVLCSGLIPVHIGSCAPYNIMNEKSGESEYGLSMRPYESKEGCVVYSEVPRCIAEEIAHKLCAELKDYSIEKK